MELVVNGSELAPTEFLKEIWDEICIANRLLIVHGLAWCVSIIECSLEDTAHLKTVCRHGLRVKVVLKFSANGEEFPDSHLLGIQLPEGKFGSDTTLHSIIMALCKNCLGDASYKYTSLFNHVPKLPEELNKLTIST